jgi:hypothetical protein
MIKLIYYTSLSWDYGIDRPLVLASLWPHRFLLAAAISRSTSASVRYSRVRRSALGARLGVTVRFTVAGVTSLRCDLAMGFALPVLTTVRTKALLRTVASRSVDTKLARLATPTLPPPGQSPGRGCGIRREPEISRTPKPFLRFSLLSRPPLAQH